MRLKQKGYQILEIEGEDGQVQTYKFDILLLGCEFQAAWLKADDEFGTDVTRENEKTVFLSKTLNEILTRYKLPEMATYDLLEFGKMVMEWEFGETKKSEETPTQSAELG